MGRPHGIWILNDSSDIRQKTRQAFEQYSIKDA